MAVGELQILSRRRHMAASKRLNRFIQINQIFPVGVHHGLKLSSEKHVTALSVQKKSRLRCLLPQVRF